MRYTLDYRAGMGTDRHGASGAGLGLYVDWAVRLRSTMSDDKPPKAVTYRPSSIDEIDGPGLSLINEPVAPDNVIALPKPRSLHATLCDVLTSSRALLSRLENGISAPPGEAWEVVRGTLRLHQKAAAGLGECTRAG
jgi:hypothetical protein